MLNLIGTGKNGECMIVEICTDCVEGALIAKKYGAKRIELCSALSVGGLTPSYGLIQQCVEKSSIEVHVMIRPKEGDFCYSKEDIELMKADIIAAKKAGAKGVVFGILTADNEVSILNKRLVDLSKSLSLEITFHRAFDFVSNYKLAIEKLIEMKVNRLLTSGLQSTAEKGLSVITELQANYGNKIQIMAGSGVNETNALKIASSGIQNLHFTARKSIQNSTKLSMGEETVVDEEKIKSIINLFK
ncbi:copper homeostasis protein CutC [Lutibacter sp.]|uniref:copper homeostasis protein CutC n=1 Tax=Lutibacter sp. TaxID=1925666 RepID=UPI002735E967|nr:copper homeostasis protein CutC [Lutibacter sp.]MDP3311931.1 copper homeostasis protein CutC [Lutibacter sp.]